VNHDHHHEEPPRRSGSRAWIVFAVLAAIGAFFLISEHRAHLFGALPYLLLALCPLMHLFHGHGGHGGHGGHRGHGDPKGPGSSDNEAGNNDRKDW